MVNMLNAYVCSEHVTMVILKGRCPRHQGCMWLYASHFFVQLCCKQLVVCTCVRHSTHRLKLIVCM
jgi:hypothetical protein